MQTISIPSWPEFCGWNATECCLLVPIKAFGKLENELANCLKYWKTTELILVTVAGYLLNNRTQL